MPRKNSVTSAVAAKVPNPAIQQPPERPEITDPKHEVFVSFSAEVSPQTSESLLAVMAQQALAGVKIVHLLLSTPGGSVMHGMNVYNVLRGLPIHLITHNAGNVDSIGNAIFLAGVERYACPHSTFMFHGVGIDVNGKVRFEEKNLKEHLASIESNQKRIGDVIRERTALDATSIESFFLNAITKNADDARICGIVHDIRDIHIPNGHPVIQLVFSR